MSNMVIHNPESVKFVLEVIINECARAIHDAKVGGYEPALWRVRAMATDAINTYLSNRPHPTEDNE